MRNIETEELVDIYAKYPAHPEEPMSDSQGHYNAISRLGDNLLMLYADRQDEVGVFCDLSWYPSDNGEWKAPDVMVVFGVPQDRSPPRQSFAQPLEGVGPSVVFELSSKSNRYGDIEIKRVWYQEHGVQEYYWIDEARNRVDVFIREGDELVEQTGLTNWTSPILGIRLTWSTLGVRAYMPDGILMRPAYQIAQDYQRLAEETEEELEEQRIWTQQERQRAEQERQRAEQEAQARIAAEQQTEEQRIRAEQEAQRAEQEAQRAEQATRQLEQLRERLRQLGIDPDAP